MAITSDRVREIFKELENGDGTAFFELVADDDVDRTVMGTHLPRSRESSLGWTGRSLRRASETGGGIRGRWLG
jgi:ketosteroid isomerase-like protein